MKNPTRQPNCRRIAPDQLGMGVMVSAVQRQENRKAAFLVRKELIKSTEAFRPTVYNLLEIHSSYQAFARSFIGYRYITAVIM